MPGPRVKSGKRPDPGAIASPARRAFFRKLLKSGYAAPAIATVLLSSLQPADPSGGMIPGAPFVP